MLGVEAEHDYPECHSQPSLHTAFVEALYQAFDEDQEPTDLTIACIQRFRPVIQNDGGANRRVEDVARGGHGSPRAPFRTKDSKVGGLKGNAGPTTVLSTSIYPFRAGPP